MLWIDGPGPVRKASIWCVYVYVCLCVCVYPRVVPSVDIVAFLSSQQATREPSGAAH